MEQTNNMKTVRRPSICSSSNVPVAQTYKLKHLINLAHPRLLNFLPGAPRQTESIFQDLINLLLYTVSQKTSTQFFDNSIFVIMLGSVDWF